MDKKVTIIGAGNVGAATAMRIFEKEIADVVMIDVVEGLAEGKALDIQQSAPISGSDVSIEGYTGDYSKAEGSDIIIVTAGMTRKPGMSREDLLDVNVKIVKEVVKRAVEVCPETILLIVSNPLDAMCYVAYKVSGFPRERVIGMAGVLDSIRFSTFISKELNVSVRNIQTMVLGGHGDTMLPLVRYTTVCGIPLEKLMEREKIRSLVERTRNAGAEIVSLLKTSAYWAPSSAIVEMVEAILMDKKKILPCSVFLEGEYGIDGVFLGVPVRLGKKGAEEIIEIGLNKEEIEELRNSANAVKRVIEKIRLEE